MIMTESPTTNKATTLAAYSFTISGKEKMNILEDRYISETKKISII